MDSPPQTASEDPPYGCRCPRTTQASQTFGASDADRRACGNGKVRNDGRNHVRNHDAGLSGAANPLRMRSPPSAHDPTLYTTNPVWMGLCTQAFSTRVALYAGDPARMGLCTLRLAATVQILVRAAFPVRKAPIIAFALYKPRLNSVATVQSRTLRTGSAVSQGVCTTLRGRASWFRTGDSDHHLAGAHPRIVQSLPFVRIRPSPPTGPCRRRQRDAGPAPCSG